MNTLTFLIIVSNVDVMTLMMKITFTVMQRLNQEEKF